MSDGKIDRSSAAMGMFFLTFVMVMFMLLEYIYYNHVQSEHDNFFTKALYTITNRNGHIIYIVNRVIFLPLFLLGLKNGNVKSSIQFEPEKYKVYLYPTLLFYIIFLLGYRENKEVYNLYAMPLLLVLQIVFGGLFSKSFLPTLKTTSHPLSKVPSTDKNQDISIKFPVINLITNQPETLIVHSPMQGIYVQGGAGTGKSASLFDPIHYEVLSKGFSGVIYDFKGSELPLTRSAYNTLIRSKDKILQSGYKVPTFHLFSLQEPFKTTCSFNVLNPKYIQSDADAKTASVALFRNLDKSSIKKQDFWINNAMLFTRSCIWMLAKNYPHFSTLPHLTALILQPITDVVSFCNTDSEIGPKMQSIITAWKNEAGSQLSGIEASVQIPFADIYNEDVFWFLAPDGTYPELDLNLNDANNPTVLCLANYESKREINNPILGSTINLILNVIRTQHKTFKTAPFLLSVDESPTIYLDKIETVPAEMRSKKVLTLLGAQTESQYINEMNKELTTVILDNLSNIFMGGTNNKEHAAKLSGMMGKYEKESISISNSDNGPSISESLKDKDVLPLEKITGQKIGQFSGKIADGEPPFFHCQFPDGRTHVKLGIKEEEMLDIPYSYFPIKDNFSDQKKQLEFQTSIWKKMKNEKFTRIVNEINSILEPHRPAPKDDGGGAVMLGFNVPTNK